MPKSPLHLQATPITLACASDHLWQQLPLPQRRQCHDLLTELLIRLIYSDVTQENSHEQQD
jgi:NifQ